MGNDASVHGYAWSDGTIHDVPEPPRTGPMTATEVQIRSAEQGKGRTPHVTQDTLDKAYAAWLKDYTAWKKRMDEWEAKYGKKV